MTAPTLSDVIDSTQAMAAISASAPADSAWTRMKLTYDANGEILEVKLLHSDSTHRVDALEGKLRALARPLPQYGSSSLTLLYISEGMGGLSLIPTQEPTCVPERGSMVRALNTLQLADNLRPSVDEARKVEFEFLIDARGEFVAVRVVKSSGLHDLDVVAERALRTVEYQPALSGRTPVATVIRQSFSFPAKPFPKPPVVAGVSLIDTR